MTYETMKATVSVDTLLWAFSSFHALVILQFLQRQFELVIFAFCFYNDKLLITCVSQFMQQKFKWIHRKSMNYTDKQTDK